MISEAAARDRVLALPGVSRETVERLNTFADSVRQWQKHTNLIANSTVGTIWSRHILDSAQLYAIRSNARSWIDIGSGGGFPGLVLAILLQPLGGSIQLVESNSKKCSFLRSVIANQGLTHCHLHDGRIESIVPKLTIPDVVTARALADVDQLLALSNCLLKSGAIGLFPKGRMVNEELTRARVNWQFDATFHPSLTDPEATIVEVSMPHASEGS